MITADPIWRSFQDLASGAEAAAYSANCLFSLATLEVARREGVTSFALTERELPGVWRWAVIDSHGQIVIHGWDPTQGGAKLACVNGLSETFGGAARG